MTYNSLSSEVRLGAFHTNSDRRVTMATVMTARNTHTTTATLKLFATVYMSNEHKVKSYG